jgi:hypothetical protein
MQTTMTLQASPHHHQPTDESTTGTYDLKKIRSYMSQLHQIERFIKLSAATTSYNDINQLKINTYWKQ